MKANLQGSRFQDKPTSIPQIPISEEYDDFSNMSLPLISGRCSRAVALAYLVSGGSWTFPDWIIFSIALSNPYY